MSERIRGNEIIVDTLKNSDELELADLLYHVHRITVNGANCQGQEWFLDPVPPLEIQYIIQKDAYQTFVEQFNKQTMWKKSENFLLSVLLYLNYAIYWWYITKTRKKYWKKAFQFLKQQDFSKILNMKHIKNRELIKVKFSKNVDYTQCYIDILDYKKAHLKLFYLQLPFLFYLSGVGSFIRPFYINESDPFIQCLYFAINRTSNALKNTERQKIMDYMVSSVQRNMNSKKLHNFFRKFNKITMCLDFTSTKSDFYFSVKEVLDYLNLKNQEFFRKFQIRIDFLLIQCPKHSLEKKEQKITILQNKDPKEFRKLIEEAQRTKHEDPQFAIKFALYIVNTNLDFREVKQQLKKLKISLNDPLDLEEGLDDHDIQNIRDSIQSSSFISSGGFSKIGKKNQKKLNQANLKQKKASRFRMFILAFKRGLQLYRNFFVSHKPTSHECCSKYVVLYFLIIFVMLDAIMTILVMFNLYYAFQNPDMIAVIVTFFAPYPCASLIAPMLGLVSISSQSYGVTKVFLMFNQMAFFNLLILLIISIVQYFTHLVPLPILLINLFVWINKIIISQLCTRYLRFTTKLYQLFKN